MMKRVFTKLLNNKVREKSAPNGKSPFFNPIVIGSAIGGGTLLFHLIIIVLAIVIVLSPLLLAQEYINTIKETASTFFEKIGNAITMRCWGTDEYCKGSFDDKFYMKLDEVYNEYKDDGIELNADLITATIYYNKSVGQDDLDDDIIGDIPDLAENMVSGSSLDFGKYRNYLINTYISKRYSDMYTSDDGKTLIADEIMSYADYYVDNTGGESTSNLSSLCPQICITNGDCYELEEYVARVVSAESGGFPQLTDNYAEEWKAQAVAARSNALYRTNYCKTTIENSRNVQRADTTSNVDNIKEVIKDTAGQILTFEGEVIPAQFDSFYKGSDYHCDNEFCYSTYKKSGNGSNPATHEVKTYQKWESYLLGGHGSGMSQYGAAYLADTGMEYEDILSFFYADDVQITFVGGVMSSGEFTEGMLFPLGVNSKTGGECVSAGNYYDSGKYHGAVDIAGVKMGYSKPYEEIPVIASTPGVITEITKNNWCSDSNYTNHDYRLPVITGCSGNHLTIKVTDPNHKYYNYKFVYYHFDSVASDLNLGDTVQAGQFLGYMGSTGNSTGFHLHFRVKDPSGNDMNNTPVPDYLTRLINKYCAEHVEGKK